MEVPQTRKNKRVKKTLTANVSPPKGGEERSFKQSLCEALSSNQGLVTTRVAKSCTWSLLSAMRDENAYCVGSSSLKSLVDRGSTKFWYKIFWGDPGWIFAKRKTRCVTYEAEPAMQVRVSYSMTAEEAEFFAFF